MRLTYDFLFVVLCSCVLVSAARKSFTALTPGKKEPTLKKILSVSEASRPIFASPKPVQQAHLPFPMKNAATTASASELYQPQPQMNQQLVHRYDLPRPSFQWSPFVFQRTYEFDSETNGDADMNGEISSGEEENSSPQSSGLSLDLDLTPLDFYAEDDVPLHKTDADALLYFLNADNGRNGEKSNAPAPAPCGEGTTETARAYATGSFTYSDSAETSWSHSLMARDLICSPVFSTNYDRSMMTGSTSKPMRISTPPSKVITEQEKFSAISNLTGPKTRSRKKPRLSSKEGNVDMTLSVPFNDSIANVPRTPPVPSLEVAEDLDIVWTDRKPYFRLGVVARNVASAWNTPTRKRNANDHIYQALSSRGSRSDPRNRKAFGITPHLPTSILKAYHSEPRRISKPSSILTGASIQPLTELRPKNNLPCLPSPIQHVGKDMNRILFGLDSPSSSAGGSTVDDF